MVGRNLSRSICRPTMRRPTLTAIPSAGQPAQSTIVTEMPEGFYQDWHPASRRQLLIVLSGTLEVETSDGKKHRCSSGKVFLADDVGSRGHRTRTIGGPARVLFVHLPPEANIGGQSRPA